MLRGHDSAHDCRWKANWGGNAFDQRTHNYKQKFASQGCISYEQVCAGQSPRVNSVLAQLDACTLRTQMCECIWMCVQACYCRTRGLSSLMTLAERAFAEDGKLPQSANAGPGPLNRFSWAQLSAGSGCTSKPWQSHVRLYTEGQGSLHQGTGKARP